VGVAPIGKSSQKPAVAPNMADYDEACEHFSWEDARRRLDGLPGGRGLNIAHEAVDRHATGPLGHKTALRFVDRRFTARDITYAELAVLSSRFANVLRSLDVGRDDPVFVLLGRIPALYIVVLGALKNNNLVCPLFAGFGPEPIRLRLALGGARVLVTTETLFRHKVAAVVDSLRLDHVILVEAETGRAGTPAPQPCCISPAARPGLRRVPSMSTTPWWHTTPPPRWLSTCIPTTCSGAPPTPGG